MNASKTTHQRALLVDKDVATGSVVRRVCQMPLEALAPERVRVAVEYSSLNYKDALCATGHAGIARKFPLVPGIDAAGEVAESNSTQFSPGDRVMIFHASFGTEFDGGLAEFVDVPSDWIYPIAKNLSARHVMILGTAGFTAAQSVDQLQRHGVWPDAGPIVVTGASGGVGCCAVSLLGKLGYHVVAVTGKTDSVGWLQRIGATEVLDRSELDDQTNKPLLPGRWAGAVDSVGGNMLTTILRSTKPGGCVTACGLVAGVDLAMTVYPFILRGVTLQGIDTAGVDRTYRAELWDRLADPWRLDAIEPLAAEISLDEVESGIEKLLAGQAVGRTIVRVR